MTGTDPVARPYPHDENDAVVLVVQALAGIPGPAWEAVTLVLDRDRLLLRVWVDDTTAEREAAEELAAEVDVLVDGVAVDLELHGASLRPYQRARHGRIVYLRRYAEPGGEEVADGPP